MLVKVSCNWFWNGLWREQHKKNSIPFVGTNLKVNERLGNSVQGVLVILHRLSGGSSRKVGDYCTVDYIYISKNDIINPKSVRDFMLSAVNAEKRKRGKEEENDTTVPSTIDSYNAPNAGNRRVSFGPVSRADTIQRLKVDWMATMDSSSNRYTSIVPVNLNSGHNGSNETHHYCPIPLPSFLYVPSLPHSVLSVHSDEPENTISDQRSNVPGVSIVHVSTTFMLDTGKSGLHTIDRKVRTVAITDF